MAYLKNRDEPFDMSPLPVLIGNMLSQHVIWPLAFLRTVLRLIWWSLHNGITTVVAVSKLNLFSLIIVQNSSDLIIIFHHQLGNV